MFGRSFKRPGSFDFQKISQWKCILIAGFMLVIGFVVWISVPDRSIDQSAPLLSMFEMYYLTKPNPNNVWGWFKSGETCHFEKFFLMPDIQLHVLRNTSIVHS